MKTHYLSPNTIYCGYSEKEMAKIEPASIALSVWSPPYNVGKEYEKDQSFEEWKLMIENVIKAHYNALKSGGFMVINIADILCFPDETMPRIQHSNPSHHKVNVTREQILEAKLSNPTFNRTQLGKLLGCSEQTIDRRLNGVNIRGGKYITQTRVQLVGNILQDIAQKSGLFLYDRRIWKKDAAWANSKWTTNSYRSVDEFEYLYFFWKPGELTINRNRLSENEWKDWGSRGVWEFPSVRANDIHEAMFPLELPKRCVLLLTDENDIVLDPFMGSGTTAIACLGTNRRYIGIDKEAKYVKLAKDNIAKLTCQTSIVF
jgi:site-specific DNA-methyltransferase (adenine-specific)